jgi:predicted amidohydrolase YtcJ
MMCIVCGFQVCPPCEFELISDSVLDLLKPLPSEIPGGEIIRDPGLGVLCDSAANLVEKISPNKTEEETTTTFKTAMKSLNSVGLVGVHEAGVTPRNVKIYQKYSPLIGLCSV